MERMMNIDLTTPVSTDRLAVEIVQKLTPKEFAFFVVHLLDTFEELREPNDQWIMTTYKKLEADLERRKMYYTGEN